MIHHTDTRQVNMSGCSLLILFLLCLVQLVLAQPTRGKRNVVEEGKIYNNQVNIFVYGFTIGFTFILLGYAIMVTYRNWVEARNMVDLIECTQ